MGVAKYAEYRQMASYATSWDSTNAGTVSNTCRTEVNVDPSRDKGSSFMDAGTIYFKARHIIPRHFLRRLMLCHRIAPR